MLKSMTGFGRGETIECGHRFNVELKSVNHRYCEIVIRMPRNINFLEERIRKLVQSNIGRGRVDVYISIEDVVERDKQVKVDKALAVAYYKAMEELQQIMKVSGKIKLKDMLSLPNLMSVEESAENVEEWWPSIEKSVNQALEELIKMRTEEGNRLAADIKNKVDFLKNTNVEIKKRAPLVVVDYRERLQRRLVEWQGEGMLDQNRIAAEIALFTDRASIDEETVRLDSHLSQMEKLLQETEPIGRKMDFLVQEMNREINTIGSKANDIQITNAVLNAKGEAEKIREQIQNIE